MDRKRINIYVDGMNLYYRRLKGTPYKWLNLQQLFEKLFKNYDVQCIKYFTAPVSESPFDKKTHIRQRVYLNALETQPKIEIIKGLYTVRDIRMPEYEAWQNGKLRTVRVMKQEEKGSDVNLASHLLMDAFHESADEYWVVTNDQDLVMPIHMSVKLGRTVGLVTTIPDSGPKKGRPHHQLRNEINAGVRKIRNGLLGDAQFPDEVSEKIRKPKDWQSVT